MLFADRLEIWNPGALPPSLTLEKLRQPHGSMPANPLLVEPMYLTRYIERMGTAIRDMIQKCREAGLPNRSLSYQTALWCGSGARPDKSPDKSPDKLTHGLFEC
jgi:predicted HTH transcriptional regulator